MLHTITGFVLPRHCLEGILKFQHVCIIFFFKRPFQLILQCRPVWTFGAVIPGVWEHNLKHNPKLFNHLVIFETKYLFRDFQLFHSRINYTLLWKKHHKCRLFIFMLIWDKFTESAYVLKKKGGGSLRSMNCDPSSKIMFLKVSVQGTNEPLDQERRSAKFN